MARVPIKAESEPRKGRSPEAAEPIDNNADYLKGNGLLGTLPAEEFERLRPHLEAVTLKVKDFLYESSRPIEYVYFPIDCVTSTMATMNDGRMVEVATIGREGMDGLPVFLGARTAPLASFCQVPGDAARMRAGAQFRGRTREQAARPSAPLHGGDVGLRRPVQRMQSATLGRAAVRSLDVAHPRPRGHGRVLPHPGVPLADAWCAASHRKRGGQRLSA